MQTSNNVSESQHHLATVPDTLDLAERAALAINALTGSAEERFFYESCQCSHLDRSQPYMNWLSNGPCLPKGAHARPLMRAMSGSTQDAEVDDKMLEAITRDIDADGLWWMPVKDRPWRECYKEDQIWPCVQGRLMVALLDRHRIDHDDRWLSLAGRLAKGLNQIALHNEDRAWYHTAYTRNGWRGHGSPHGTVREVFARSEPPFESPYNIGLPLRGLARWYVVSGDKQALELADRLARFYMKPTMWGSSIGPELLGQDSWSVPKRCIGPEMLVGAEHGHWQGHFHTNTMGMMGLLEYAVVRGDARIMRFVQQFYEYARCFGIARMGFFPAGLRPVEPSAEQKESGNYLAADGSAPQCDEGCCVADMIWLAANLSKAGIGDYWDDVDQYTRNQLVEHQLLRRDLIEAMVAAGPTHTMESQMETEERVIERNIGSFASGADPTWLYGWWTMCCTGNCSVALHEAWDSILGHENGVVIVNLLLNRASAWLDVDSYLPYEGKIVLKNKAARTVYLRKPLWVDRAAIRCQVNGKAFSPHWVGNYLAVTELTDQDVVRIEFPVVETTETYTLPTYPGPYTLRLRGNTVVDISPRQAKPAYARMSSDDGHSFDVAQGYPIYLRDELRIGRQAPMKTAQHSA